MQLQPLGDKVVVARIDSESKTPGGIVLPDTAKKKSIRGRVLAVGPGRVLDDGQRTKMEVKKDDQVVFNTYAGTEVQMGNDELLIMSETDILAIVQ